MNARKWVAAATTAAGLALAAEAGAVPVGLELMLLVDTSGSIDNTEYQLQRTGYVQAFQSAAVQNAILANPTGSIAVTYISDNRALHHRGIANAPLVDDGHR